MTDVPRLETERLVLRTLRDDDADGVFEIFGNDAVTRYYDLTTFTSIEQAVQLLVRIRERNAKGDQLRWAIALKQNDRLIGTCGFVHFARYLFTGTGYDRAEIGYDLAQAYWGQGIMPEALRAVIQYGFDVLHLHRIEALVMLGNEQSARVLEKLGFSREGVLREYGFWKNTFWDLEMFSLLKREWSKEK